MENNTITGLTSAQVQKRIADGQKNIAPKSLTKTNGQIIFENVFTVFNFINVVLGCLVFLTGSYKNMLFLVIAIVNTAIGVFQELRAKQQVDKMALLSQTKVTVVRNGKATKIDPDQVVLDDIIVLSLGDQVVADGVIVKTQELEVDESQITGESDPVVKKDGSKMISGSFIVSGHGLMKATKVGDGTFVNSLTSKVKVTKQNNSELINLIKKIIKILTIIIIPLGICLFTSRILHGVNINNAILGTVAAMIGMIPEGLVLLSSVTLAVSAYHLARRHVLVRDLASIETLARVDTLCLDKTGTITNGKLQFKKLIIANQEYKQSQVSDIIGSIFHEINDNNATAVAMKKAFPKHPYQATKIIPFSSARKWSGITIANQGNFVMGAPQFVLDMDKSQSAKVKAWAEKGYRVLAIAKADQMDSNKLTGTDLLAYILITDVIRSDAPETLRYFYDQGVNLKVISGDDPTTVANIAERVGIKNWNRNIDMSKVPDDVNYQELVKQNAIFGRVNPKQKESLIKALQANGHKVAMTGDGVNDILALKQSDCGIAMASGNESTKSIADFVLINSNFAALVSVLKEGRRVINNIDSIAALYLIKTMFSVILTILFLFLAKNYPFQPIQLTPINSLMVGIPSFFLALAPAFHPIQDRFVAGIREIALPSALCVVLYIILISIISFLTGISSADVGTLNVLLTGFICWQALIFISRPLNRYKLVIVTASMITFLAVFLFLGKLFSLTSLFTISVGLTGLLLILTINPVFLFVQRVSNLTWDKIKRLKK